MSGNSVTTTIHFTHWKTGEPLEATGELLPYNPSSDRHVIKTEDGEFIDIIKTTITKIVVGEQKTLREVNCRRC